MTDGAPPEAEGVVVALPRAPDAIEIRHLRAVVAVAEELNFSRAAARLYITQPALSRQVRSLERLVGCDLFRRSTHGVETTLAGDALLVSARQILADLDGAVANVQSIGGEHAARLTRLWDVFVDASIGGGDVPKVRAAVEELHGRFSPPPEVELRPTNASGVPALVSTPVGADGTPILFLHGGGYVAGSAFGYRHLSGALALVAGRPVVVPDYRLAPEHPFPAALEDAICAYLSILDDGAAPGEVAIAGDSAGGGLALSLLFALRERQLPLPGCAVLMCPWVDLTGTFQRTPEDAPIVITPEDTARFAELYLGSCPIDHPLLDALNADLSGLPPLLVQAATGDSVMPEAELLVERGRAAGGDIHLDMYPVPTHNFHIFWTFLPEAGDALLRAAEFMNTSVDERHSSNQA